MTRTAGAEQEKERREKEAVARVVADLEKLRVKSFERWTLSDQPVVAVAAEADEIK